MPTRPISEVIHNRAFVAVPSHISVRDAALLMKSHHTSAVMVVNSRKMLTGICTERDIVMEVICKARDPEHTPVASIMTEHPRTVSASKPLGHALHMMYEGGFRHVPVIDTVGRPIGILTARDALRGDALDFADDLVRREEITVIL